MCINAKHNAEPCLLTLLKRIRESLGTLLKVLEYNEYHEEKWMVSCGRDCFHYSFPLFSIVIEPLVFGWGHGNTEYR